MLSTLTVTVPLLRCCLAFFSFLVFSCSLLGLALAVHYVRLVVAVFPLYISVL